MNMIRYKVVVVHMVLSLHQPIRVRVSTFFVHVLRSITDGSYWWQFELCSSSAHFPDPTQIGLYRFPIEREICCLSSSLCYCQQKKEFYSWIILWLESSFSFYCYIFRWSHKVALSFFSLYPNRSFNGTTSSCFPQVSPVASSSTNIQGIKEFMQKPMLPYPSNETILGRKIVEERERIVEKRMSQSST